jgi:hypothetical protein
MDSMAGNDAIMKNYRGGHMIRIIALFTFLCAVVPLHAEAKPGCDRTGLQGAVDKYLVALKEGKPSRMPLSVAPNAKYIENRKEIPFGQGIWKTPLVIDHSRSLLDVETCQTFTEIIHTSSNHPYVIGTRLKIEEGTIAVVEALITDKDDWLFNAEKYLKYSKQEKWDILPADKRSDRQTLIKVANAYFDIFSNPSANNDVPWGIPCARLEGGAYTNEKGDPNASCISGVPLEGSLKIVNRRFIVDVDMGSVVGLADFGEKNGWPDSHIFRLENGKVRFVHTLTLCPESGCAIAPPKEKAKT